MLKTDKASWRQKRKPLGHHGDAAGIPQYTAEEIVKIKTTDRIAVSTYVQGNTGAADVYTVYDTAYEIRQALRGRYENTEAWGLTALTKKYNNCVRNKANACPDEWFDQLH